MPNDLYFLNATTGKKYKVISRDAAAGTIRLKGEYGEFEETYSKEEFQKMGYSLVREDGE